MKKPLSKKAKGLLLALGILALLGACIICVSAYAKKVMNEPKFEIPEAEPLASATAIPDSDAEKLLYVEKLFAGSFGSVNNVSKKTEFSISDESIVSSAKDSDLAVIRYAKGQILNDVGETYESFEKKEGSEISAPSFLCNSGINECTFEQGQTGDDGEIKDENYYFFDFDLSPVAAGKSDVFNLGSDKKIPEFLSGKLSEMCTINDFKSELISCAVNGKADRVYDQLRQISFGRTYLAEAEIEFTGEYSALGKINIQFEIGIIDKYDFTWYGARFTEKAVYMNPGDEKTLPAAASVAEGTEQSEFTLSFVSSDESVASVSEDGIVTAVKSSDKPVEITMTLEYKGFTFTDKCLVTVTDLEVKE
ncbi:MAG: hypothetical protein MJ173_05430 [Clostridia bacterium]|nr:hypothetical protein [Clostridia bacterium]